ncbi:MAG: hypothetical protein H7222_11945 [Methylotenera sp.]|nr:hypothetical protein [Oligoflexia bacterium]
MNRGHVKFFILLAVVTVLLLWLFPSRKPLPLPVPVATPSTNPTVSPAPSSLPSAAHTTRKQSAEKSRDTPRTPKKLPDVARALPEIESLRSDVQAHPHETPASMLRFSDVLAQRMEDVKHHPDHSMELMKEFRDCVSRSSEIPAAQAMCLRNAERLALEHPRETELKREWEKILELATPETRQIVERIRRI